MRRRMQVVEAGGFRFYFAYDRRQTDTLHIELRTGFDVRTAVDVFFDGWHSWNEDRSRFECYSELVGLYWAWLYGDDSSTDVLMISCFPRED